MPFRCLRRSGLISCLSPLRQTICKSSLASPKFQLVRYPENDVQKFDNGFKVGWEYFDLPSACVALHMNIGTCREDDTNSGIVNVLQQMAFKGTGKRSWKDIETQATERGAYLSSYAERETNALFIRVLNSDIEWAVELLAEIASTRSFDDTALKYVQKNVNREMEEKENDLKYMVFDYLHATAYQGTCLQRPVLGQPDVVENLTTKNLSDFVSAHYKAPVMALSVAGGVPFDQVMSMAQSHFASVDMSFEGHAIPSRKPIRFTASDLRHRDDAYPLAHVVFAQEGPGHASTDNLALRVGLAGDGSMDLFRNCGSLIPNKWMVQEGYESEHIHAAEFFHLPYHDTSLFGCYFVCDGHHLFNQGLYYVPNEILKNALKLTAFKVDRCKNTLKTNICSQLNSTLKVSDNIGRQLISLGRRMPTEELLARISKIDVEDVKDAFYRYCYEQPLAAASFGPVEALLDINNLESKYRKILH